ncbi:hypothetical protein VSVS12_01276 [Vibrio scophthalmi]|uniref:Uncharacterized protein n=1 Tax=Vibrio scophthalmi TaxID=45658 RepID=A0A1B1NN73_9VIBR|nr:hypothetical protein VSVS12_01276 [Vibrio scophthalmi]ANU36849.1 hypothetical protein VSVS05_01724 [Vibrio scophthalmi]ODS11795.1 hypothetical protein VSF3289_02062 [Vibrio scophthalmi]
MSRSSGRHRFWFHKAKVKTASFNKSQGTK